MQISLSKQVLWLTLNHRIQLVCIPMSISQETDMCGTVMIQGCDRILEAGMRLAVITARNTLFNGGLSSHRFLRRERDLWRNLNPVLALIPGIDSFYEGGKCIKLPDNIVIGGLVHDGIREDSIRKFSLFTVGPKWVEMFASVNLHTLYQDAFDNHPGAGRSPLLMKLQGEIRRSDLLGKITTAA